MYLHYIDKVPKSIVKRLYNLYKETLKEIEKDYEDLDIKDYEIIERIIFEDKKH